MTDIHRLKPFLWLPGGIPALALSFALALSASAADVDYGAGEKLRRATNNTVFRDNVDPQWLEGGERFWYKVETGPGTHEFFIVDVANGYRRPCFDHERLAKKLTEAGVKNAAADRLPLRNLRFDPVKRTARFVAGGKGWTCDLRSYELTTTAPTEEDFLPGWPPREAPRSSRRTGPQVNVEFVNKTDSAVKLFWVDTGGERQEYGQVEAGDTHRQHTFAGHIWLVADAQDKPIVVFVAEENRTRAVIAGTPENAPKPAPRKRDETNRRRAQTPRGPVSPDGRYRAFIRDHDVFLREQGSGDEFRLSADGTAEEHYRDGFFWSPDSKKLAVIRRREGQKHPVFIVESSPRDQLQPKLIEFDYLKPGDRIDQDRPCLFDVEAGKPVAVDNALFANPWSISHLRWEEDSRRLVFLYNQRGHQVMRVVGVNARTGEARAIIDEQSDTFIHYSGKLFIEFVDEKNEILWASERDGWNHLYLYDAATGRLKNQVTRGDWLVRGVDRVDTEKRQIWFRAGGIYPEQDPYYEHYCRIDFDGRNLVRLTEGDGDHDITYSPDGEYFVDAYSRVDMPPVHELRRSSDGKLIGELEKADWSALLKTGWRPPERFVAKGRDGQTDIYGVICRPSHFDKRKKYPVIEHIYAGPHSAFTPKAFRSFHGMQELAELGFIVVRLDGMGTSRRSKAFHDVCWQNIKDSGFPDRVLWIAAAAKKYPSMDLSRVGIYGGSAGGQSALAALLTHGDFYHAAVADCGCHDNRMDKIWWNEQWMGWPVGDHYAENSNVTMAPHLKGKLLLMVGELDRNVDPASTMQVVSALIKADKFFELLVYPGGGHGIAGTRYGKKRLHEFFVRHFLDS